jgi:hypothetical protein
MVFFPHAFEPSLQITVFSYRGGAPFPPPPKSQLKWIARIQHHEEALNLFPQANALLTMASTIFLPFG